MRLVGEMAIWIALLMAAWAFLVYVVGTARERNDLLSSGDRALHAVAVLSGIALAALLRGLVGHDFTMRYVATYSSVTLAPAFLVSALWSGPAGATLAFAFLLALAAVLRNAIDDGRRERIDQAVLALLLTFVLAALCLALDPLRRLEWAPVDGVGMLPALQSAGAVLYAPLLLIACAGYAVAVAGMLASAARRELRPGSLDAMTRWVASAWFLNTLALVAAIWWTYHEPPRTNGTLSLPIRNVVFFLWVPATAFLAARRVITRRRERRPFATGVAIAAILMIVASIAGWGFRTQQRVNARVADPVEVVDAFGARWSLTSQGLSSYNALNRSVMALGLEIQRNEAPAGIVSSETRQYLDFQGEPVFPPAKRPAVRSSLREDLYVVLEDFTDNGVAVLSVSVNPLMSWLWIGGILLAASGLVLVWPVRTPAPDDP